MYLLPGLLLIITIYTEAKIFRQLSNVHREAAFYILELHSINF